MPWQLEELNSTQQVINNIFITGEVLLLKESKQWKLYLRVTKNSLRPKSPLE